MFSTLQNPLSDRSSRLCLLSMLALTAACGDDVTATTDNSSTGENTTGVTAGATTSSSTATSDGSTTDADTSSTGSAESSTTGDPTRSSTTAADTTGGDTENSTTGTTDDPSTGGSTSDASSTTGMTKEPQECPYGTLDAPGTLTDTTLGQDSEFVSTCGGGGAPDFSYTLTAPGDGVYIIRASSPDGVVDPLLAVFDGTCGGPELDCNSNIDPFGTDAEVSVQLTAGQVVTVVADGFALSGGLIELNTLFFAGTCPNDDIGNTVPAVYTGSTTGADNTVFASCGGATAGDDTLTFTAPEDGVYAFDTAGSDFDTIMFLQDGCGGDEFGCSDNVGADETSHLNLLMTAGQEVIVAVDGAALEEGNYTVSVDLDVCPDVVLDSVAPLSFSGTTAGELDASTGSCGGSGAPGVSFSYIAPEPGVYTIDTMGSSFDTVLYSIAGCGGAETACNDNGGIDETSRINVTLAAGEEVLFVVDGANAESGAFDINISLDECPDFALDGALPLTVNGSTEFEVDSSTGTCTFGTAPDVAYTFTAPSDGSYVFSTENDGFTTGLYYYPGETCGGVEQGCSTFGGPLGAQLIIDLLQDETITVVVDGGFGGSGNYTLNVENPQCGNGIVETGEDCDGADLSGQSCFSQGQGGGILDCTPSCDFDYTACGDSCGNAVLDAGETCDLTELGQQNCTDFGFAGGALDCGLDCDADTTQCSDDIVVVCSSPGMAIDGVNPSITDTITIPDVGTIADIDVFIDIPHAYATDLQVLLTADDLAVSNTLFAADCGSTDDVFATFNDEGSNGAGAVCVQPIAIEGNLIPDQPLTAYDGLSATGEWTLSVTDTFPAADDGTLDEWCVYITLE